MSAQTVRKNESLAKHTTFKIGGEARLFFEPVDEVGFADLQEEYPEAFILGGGSNLLVSDKGLDTVVSIKGLKKFEANAEGGGNVLVEVGAGLGLTAFSRKAQRLGLSGMEFAFGIPGTVGGAVVMNAGAFGSEIANTVVSAVVCVNGKTENIKAEELHLSYRSSKLPEDGVVMSALFRLRQDVAEKIMERMKDVDRRRKETQPMYLPSAGSIFKNPAGGHAGRIIEELGFKGARIGDAMVSDVHANFIVNMGKATASDVLSLIKKIEDKALEKLGIRLEREIKLAGRF